jgi:hypothetical protein
MGGGVESGIREPEVRGSFVLGQAMGAAAEKRSVAGVRWCGSPDLPTSPRKRALQEVKVSLSFAKYSGSGASSE